MAVQRMVGARRDHGEARHDPLRDAPVVVAVLGIAAGADVQAARALHHLEVRLHVRHIVFVALGALEQRVGREIAAVQERDVARIDAALHRLQPVRFLQALGDEALLGRHRGEFPLRQRRLLFRRPHIGPQHRPELHQRVGGQLDLLAEAGFDRLRRHLDALAGDVVFPAVIRAAQPALLVAAEPQRHAAVGAEFVDQAVAALAVAERQQPLGQQLDPDRRRIVLGQFLGHQRRDPVAAEHAAHGGARPGLRQEIVLFFPEHRLPPGARGPALRMGGAACCAIAPIPSILSR